MLVLSRKEGEEVLVGDNVIVRIVRVRGDRVTIGFEAPKDVIIKRTELLSKEDQHVDRGL